MRQLDAVSSANIFVDIAEVFVDRARDSSQLSCRVAVSSGRIDSIGNVVDLTILSCTVMFV